MPNATLFIWYASSKPLAAQRASRGARLVQVAVVVGEFEGLHHHVRVQARHIELPALSGFRLRLDHLERVHVVEDRPLVAEVLRHLDLSVE